MTEPIQCPQCKCTIQQPDSVRCPRCNALLITPCTGSCSKCSLKNQCDKK